MAWRYSRIGPGSGGQEAKKLPGLGSGSEEPLKQVISTVAQAVQQALRSGENLYIDYRILLPDGSIRWIVARGQRYLRATGQVTD